jgi:hypothetical protein
MAQESEQARGSTSTHLIAFGAMIVTLLLGFMIIGAMQLHLRNNVAIKESKMETLQLFEEWNELQERLAHDYRASLVAVYQNVHNLGPGDYNEMVARNRLLDFMEQIDKRYRAVTSKHQNNTQNWLKSRKQTMLQ